ncbi:MAG TPA: hypothetical protein VNP96_12095 [Solirubrobacterales bacterium]|nr:hypothetical protein [Solirubrobacterales bacterium]
MSAPGDQVSSVAVNQATRDVYVARLGSIAGTGDLHRFDSSGADLGCTLTLNPGPGTVTRPAGVTVNPLDGSLRVLDLEASAAETRLRKFPAACGTEEVTPPFPVPVSAVSSKPIPQLASDAAGNTYLPNPNTNALQKFDSNGTEVTSGGFPITGLTNPTAAAVDAAGDVYVLNARVAPAPAASEKQTITIVGASAGETFKLTFDGVETAPIAYSTTGSVRAANIRTALEALPAIGAANVGVTIAATPVVTFQGSLAGVDVPLMTCAFTGPGPSCSVATTTLATPKTPGSLVKFDSSGNSLGTVLSGDFTSFARDSQTGGLFLGVGWGGAGFAESAFRIRKYSAGGAELTEFGTGMFKTPVSTGGPATNVLNQLAIDETSGAVYAADAGESQAEVFDPGPTKTLTTASSGTGGTGQVQCELEESGSTEPSCSTEYEEGTRVTLVGNPDPGAKFVQWIGGTGSATSCNGSTSPTCTFDLDDDSSINAEFGSGGESLTITYPGTGAGQVNCKVNGGSIDEPCALTYPSGTNLELIALGSHSSFVGFENGTGDAVGCTTSPCGPFALTGPSSVEANFAQDPPTVLTTAGATEIAQTSAKVAGTVNPNGGDVTECKVEYGTSTSYGSEADCEQALPLEGSSPVNVSKGLTGLSANTTYHFRFKAKNAGGTETGGDQTFTTLVPSPTLTPIGFTQITQTGAKAEATVNPNGGNVTSCKFEYGLTTSYGSEVACTPSPGSGTSPAAVSATISGLTANTAYHVRLKATNAGGTSETSDASFSTLPNAPTVTTTAGATEIAPTTAKVAGTVNPNGGNVTQANCKVEYGLTTSYGSVAECSGAPGSGASPVNVSKGLTGLSANTTYHFRFVATNSGGTGEGGDQTFTTLNNARALAVDVAGEGSVQCKAGAGSFGVCTSSYADGTELTLKANPGPHSSFDGWGAGAGSATGCTGTGECTFTITADSAVDAPFTLIQRTLTIDKAGSGDGSITCETSSGSGLCQTTYTDGTTLVLHAAPDSHSTFTSWAGCDSEPSAGACAIVEIDEDKTLTATFTAEETGNGGGGSGSSDDSPPPVPLPPPPSKEKPGMASAPATATVQGSAAAIAIACQGGPCSGTVRIFAKVKGKSRQIGKAAYSIPAGESKTIRVKINNAQVKRLLGKGHTVKVKLEGPGFKSRTLRLKPRAAHDKPTQRRHSGRRGGKER